MEEMMSKAKLIETLRSRRAEWDALLAMVPPARMEEPGVAGHWSVKDIIAHITYYERWMADRMHEQLRGESYTPTSLDQMHFEERNVLIYEEYRGRSISDVLSDSRQVFQRLMEAVQAHSEAFLIDPQRFEGAPGPVVVWQMLQGDVYDHYPQHMPSIKSWLAAQDV
jgi:hypothetical protein